MVATVLEFAAIAFACKLVFTIFRSLRLQTSVCVAVVTAFIAKIWQWRAIQNLNDANVFMRVHAFISVYRIAFFKINYGILSWWINTLLQMKWTQKLRLLLILKYSRFSLNNLKIVSKYLEINLTSLLQLNKYSFTEWSTNFINIFTSFFNWSSFLLS